MDGQTIGIIIVVAFFLWLLSIPIKSLMMTPEQRAQYIESLKEKNRKGKGWGIIHPEIICPHCQTRGNVHIKEIQKKKGISGGKATAALLTGGVSLLATGLSRKEATTQAHCDNCSVTWTF